jgi:hypothetical protein
MPRSPKEKKAKLTPKQSKLVQAFAEGAKSNAEAAIAAGYSPNHARQSGFQALESIRRKTPETMDELGLSVPALIDKHIRPLLEAEETKLFLIQTTEKRDGKRVKVTKALRVKVPDNATRRYITRLALELQGAFPPADPKLAAQIGVKVVVVDIPRPKREVASDA